MVTESQLGEVQMKPSLLSLAIEDVMFFIVDTSNWCIKPILTWQMNMFLLYNSMYLMYQLVVNVSYGNSKVNSVSFCCFYIACLNVSQCHESYTFWYLVIDTIFSFIHTIFSFWFLAGCSWIKPKFDRSYRWRWQHF